VIQAPLWLPNAIFHAGSSDWKYSSGWKNVLTQSALIMRKHTSNGKTNLVPCLYIDIDGWLIVVLETVGTAPCSLRRRLRLAPRLGFDCIRPNFEAEYNDQGSPASAPSSCPLSPELTAVSNRTVFLPCCLVALLPCCLVA
jgi:hypothetical protein